MKPEELKGMMKRVYDVCQRHPECRSDDKRLIWMIWLEDAKAEQVDVRQTTAGDGICFTMDMPTLRLLSSHETVRRSRQMLQQHGLCLPSEKVSKGRQRRAKAIRTSPPVAPIRETLF